MNVFIRRLKWEFILLKKNNIVNISFAVTLIYGLVLFFLKDVGSLDVVLVALVLNDPSIIGYFFIALVIYTEIKHQILPAVFITPVNIHAFLLSKTISLSIIGILCSLGLAIAVKGFDFDMLSFSIGAMAICLISTLLGLFMLTFADEFLKFAMISIPFFLVYVNIPLLQYLGVVELGLIKYAFPIQGGLDMIDNAVSGTKIDYWWDYVSTIVFVFFLYWLAFRQFSKKTVYR